MLREMGIEGAKRQLSAEAADAWRVSVFGVDIPEQSKPLFDDASEATLEAGTLVDRLEAGPEPVLLIVIDGLLRIYSARGERQVTAGYRAAGDVFGIVTLFAPAIRRQQISLTAEAMVDSRVLRLPPQTLVDLAMADRGVLTVVFDQLAKAVGEGYELLAQGVFLNVKQRVARCLLDFAVRSDGLLMIYVHHQEIADAVGSVRQVVSRTISVFCSQGLLCREGDHYVLVDPAGLHRAASADE